MSGRRSSVRWRERSVLVRALRLWRTRNPRTFRDKVRYKMLRDHRPLMVTFADKAAVRGYVAAVVGERYLPRVYAILDDPAALADVRLPAACVVKPTHGSGAAIVVSDRAPHEARLPAEPGSWVYSHVRPEAAPTAEVIRIAAGWVTQLYGQGPNREWVYGQIPRRVIVEELLTGSDGAVPDDYKFFVFHGACAFVQVDKGRFGSRTQDFFTAAWEHLALRGSVPCADSRADEAHSTARDDRGRRETQSGNGFPAGRPIRHRRADRRRGADQFPRRR